MPVVAKVWRKYQNSWRTTCSDWVWIIRMIWSDNCNHRLTQSGMDPVQLGAISRHMQIVFIIGSTNPNVCPGLKTIRYCQFSMKSGVEIIKSLTFLFLRVCRSYRFETKSQKIEQQWFILLYGTFCWRHEGLYNSLFLFVCGHKCDGHPCFMRVWVTSAVRRAHRSMKYYRNTDQVCIWSLVKHY